MAIAGIWRPGSGNQRDAFAMLTTALGPDVASIHNRQVVVLRPENWCAWLDLSGPDEDLLRPGMRGLFRPRPIIVAPCGFALIKINWSGGCRRLTGTAWWPGEAANV
jgi:hypothetical protein